MTGNRPVPPAESRAPARRWPCRPRTFVLALAVVVAAVLVLVLVAQFFGPADITPSRPMVSGTWSSRSGATPTTLTLKPDGTFTERGLPADGGETSTLNIPADGTGGVAYRCTARGAAGSCVRILT